MARKRGPNVDRAIRQKIWDLSQIEGRAPADIERVLRADYEKEPGRVPAKRTIQRVLAEAPARTVTEEWRPADETDGQVVELVLPVIALLSELSKGEAPYPTKDEAKWLARVRRWAPDLKLESAFRIARFYVTSEQEHEPMIALDAFLSYAPWASREADSRYIAAVDNGWIKSRYWIFIDPEQNFVLLAADKEAFEDARTRLGIVTEGAGYNESEQSS